MLLHRHPHSSRRFIVAITCTVITLFHRVEGFPVMVEKAGVVLGSPPQPILPHSDAGWFDDSAAVSTLVTRSYDAVHDSVFIPTIATMGVLVIICILCFYNLIVHKDTVHPRGTYNEAPTFSSQNAVGQLERGHESRPLSRISKATRGSVLSASASMPGSPSVSSNMLDRLQRRREEEHRRLVQQQDPYEQYMSSNQGYPYPQQHYQYQTVSGSAVHHGEGVQPQFPLSAHVPTAQPPKMNVNPNQERHWAQQEEHQILQQSDPRQGIPQSPAAQTSSTRVSSGVLSYQTATPPEARRHPLPNNPSQLPNKDYFSPQHPAGGIPLPTQPSTHGNISVPANYTPPLPSTSNSPQAAHVHSFTNQPPGYSDTEMMGNNVQGNVASTTPHLEHKS